MANLRDRCRHNDNWGTFGNGGTRRGKLTQGGKAAIPTSRCPESKILGDDQGRPGLQAHTERHADAPSP